MFSSATGDVFRFLVGFLILHRTCLADMNTFFPQIKGDLTLVTWAHAVNNGSYLSSTLNNTSIMMIEADVVLGTTNGSTNTTAIMGHPPMNKSDLTLDSFMYQISTFNNLTSNNSARKGVKLDFKSIEAFNASLPTIIAYNNNATFPLWINADILAGPTNAPSLPVNANEFLTQCQSLNMAVLSLGWTTELTNNATFDRYTDDHISDMIRAINATNVKNEITFAVRAALAANSLPQMKNLLAGVNSSTLTIWMSNATDKVHVGNLTKLINDEKRTRIYLDVPEDIRKAVNGAGKLAMPAMFSLVAAALTVMFS